MMYQLNISDINKIYRKKYYFNWNEKYSDQVIYLYSGFIGCVNVAEELYSCKVYKFSRNQEEDILNNIKLILNAIDNNLPELPRIREQQAKVNLAFCHNFWLHELLLDETWLSFGSEKKYEYINFAFQKIFKEFDTKAISDFDTEFLPYDMPWATIPYHFVHSQDFPKLEEDVFNNLYKQAYLKKHKFQAEIQESLKLNDDLNLSLRISNKLRNFRLRTMYFDLNLLKPHQELSDFIKSEWSPAIVGEFLSYKFKLDTIWNFAFFLSATKFRETIDTIRGEMPQHGKQSRKTEFQNFIQCYMSRFADQDLKILMTKWEQNLGIQQTSLVFDNYQVLGEHREKFEKNIKDLSKVIHTIKTIDRSKDYTHKKSVVQIKTYELYNPAVSFEHDVREIVRTIFYLNRFDKGLIHLLSTEVLNLEWTDDIWDKIGCLEWVQSRSKKWFYIYPSQHLKQIIKPFELDELTKECKQAIFNYLICYKESRLDEDIKAARLDALCYGYRWFPESEEFLVAKQTHEDYINKISDIESSIYEMANASEFNNDPALLYERIYSCIKPVVDRCLINRLCQELKKAGFLQETPEMVRVNQAKTDVAIQILESIFFNNLSFQC